MTTAAPSTDLAARLRTRIRQSGPVPLVEVMAEVAEAYYGRGDVFGRGGDFITAPEISQVFGELIGLWCAVVWDRMGHPADFRLVECGPGRGTLMADLLRATARVPGFAAAADVHLIERSEALRAKQRAAVTHGRVTWHSDIRDVPPGPMILVANEFADALPIQQFVRADDGWHERCVGLKGDDFVFVDGLVCAPNIPKNITSVSNGSIFERNDAACDWMRIVARRIALNGGAALVIDYGHVASALGDTLQAVKEHRFHSVLSDLGAADLTAHVDFEALADAARGDGAMVLGPVLQGTWLGRLGIMLRVAQLTKGKPAEKARDIAAAARRLTAPDGMGMLFKVMAVASASVANPSLAPLDGFGEDAAP
jgi:SAM-dependent MidA family methyltransferase